MAKIRGTYRMASGAKRPNMSTILEALKDQRVWIRVGTVVQEPVISDTDIIVPVKLEPSGEIYDCAMGCVMADANGNGFFSVPEVGTEVCVAIPEGSYDELGVVIRCLGGGQVPDRAAAGRLLLKCPEVEVQADTVKMGSDPGALIPADGLVHGTGIDPFTGSSYFALGNTSAKILGEK